MTLKKKPDSLGQTEQMVLAVVMNLGKEAYGLAIHEKLTEVALKDVNPGGVYVTLERLEQKNLVTSTWSEPTAARGGRARRHFSLTKAGMAALRESVETSQRISELCEESW
jgi:PadR family transcriptional regulator PadR